MNEELNNRINAVMANSDSIINALSGMNVGGLPLQSGDTIVLRLSEGETVSNIIDIREYNGFSYSMIRHDGGEISGANIFRNGNGLPFTVSDIPTRLRELVGWILERNGVLILRITGIRAREGKTNVKYYYTFQIQNQPMATETPQTETPQTETPQTETPQTESKSND